MKNQNSNVQPLTEYISFSGVKDWEFCPHYYKLTRIDKLYKFEGNVHTAFGTSMHSALEYLVKERNSENRQEVINKAKDSFEDTFKKELVSVGDTSSEKVISDMVA